ncbi:hypothetical protein [uncultured Parasphingorhabdus sp.]|uniref:hypothetical protein n=1 Tax=uncultured Parasphingorhabdus sp. TaxID=2709694 RepID=UPI0030DC4CFE
MTRLLLSGLLVVASLSFAMQPPASKGLGAEQSHDQFSTAISTGAGPYILGKTSQTIQLARKQIAKDSGPDKASRILVASHFPGSGTVAGFASRNAHAGYFAEHILFRSRSRTISTRAPPTHFSG